MPLTSLSTPFNYLITQIENDLIHAADICREIRTSQRPNHRHQLDALLHSLSNGPTFIEQERQKVAGIEGADIDGGDDVVRNTFTCYIREVEEINSRLEAIAHHSHHHHEHRSFFFPAPHHHKEDPHFHEIRREWETIRDGIGHTFAQFKYRLDLAAKKKEQDKKDKEKLEKEKKDAKDKADAELKKAQEKAKKEKERLEQEKQEAKKNADEALKEEKAKAKKGAEELEKKITNDSLSRRHTNRPSSSISTRSPSNETHVERLVKAKLEEDPIDQIDRFAGVFDKLQHSIGHQDQDTVGQFRRVADMVNDLQHSTSPRAQDTFEQFRQIAGIIKELQQPTPVNENPIDQARRLAELFNSFQRSALATAKAEDPIDQVSRLLKAMKELQPSISASPATTTSRPLSFDPRSPPISINNVIESGIPAGDVEEIDVNGAHVTQWTAHPTRIPVQVKRVNPTIQRKVDPIPATLGGIDGDFYPRHGW